MLDGRDYKGPRRSGSWTLFVLLVCLSSVLILVLGEAAREAEEPVTRASLPLFVPAVVRSDRHDWLSNGNLEAGHREGSEAAPVGWEVFTVTTGSAGFQRSPGAPFLQLRCPGECVAGLRQRLDDLPAGEYSLEGDVFLETASADGLMTVRLGFDGQGGTDPGSATVLWSEPASPPGWQRLGLELDHAGGTATVFVIFDKLTTEADCRLSSVRLLGPPPATLLVTAMTWPTASPEIVEVELRGLRVAATDLEWSGPEQTEVLVDRAAQAGFNTLFVQVRHRGYAYYRPGVEPAAPEWADAREGYGDWDPLEELLGRAHAAGLQVYAWVEVLPIWAGMEPPPPSEPEHMYNLFSARFSEEWLQGNEAGPLRGAEGMFYASPLHSQVRDYLAALCRDIVSRYEVDGLHLTGLAYAGGDAGTDPASRQSYAAYLEGGGDREYEDWRRLQLTELLRRLQGEVLSVRPACRLSVGVWPLYGDEWDWEELEAYSDLGQDVQAWVEGGYVDLVMPELQVAPQLPEPERQAAALEGYLPHVRGRLLVPVLPGEVASFAELNRAIVSARAAGVDGVVISDFRALEERGYWDDLASGPFARKASVPPALWRWRG